MGLRRGRAVLMLATVGGALLVGALATAMLLARGGTDSVGTPQLAIDTLRHEVVQTDLLPPDARVVAYRLDAPLPAGTRIAAYLPDLLPEVNEPPPDLCATAEYALDEPAWFFWIDDYAGALFAHHTRYVLIDVTTGRIRSVIARAWPPCIDGQIVEQWIDDTERAKPGNRAFTSDAAVRDSRPPASDQSAAALADRPHLAAAARALSLRPAEQATPEPSFQAQPERPAVVAINGWTVGEVGKAQLDGDTQRLRDFARAKGIPDSGRRIVGESPTTQIAHEIDRVIAGPNPANAVLLLITGHGGVTRSGESAISMGGHYLYRSQLRELLARYPTVTFSLAVAACRSADFKSIASGDNALKNVARVETCAATIHDLCMGSRNDDPAPGVLWSKAVIESVTKDPLFDGCVSCALASGAAAGTVAPGASVFDPLSRDPATGEYVPLHTGDPRPAGFLPSTTATATAGTPAPGTAPSTSGGGLTPGAGPAATQAPATATATSTAPVPSPAPTSAGTTRTFTGAFGGSGTFRSEDCTWRTTYTGTITLTLTFSGDTVTGTARHQGSYHDVLVEGPERCDGDAAAFDQTVGVRGTAQAMQWGFGDGGSVNVTASLIGNAVVGRGVVTDAAYAGSATIPFTLN